MTANPNRTLSRVAAAGLLVGAVFGLAGTLVASPGLQASQWAVDGVALVIATSLLTLKYLRAGSDLLCAGFLVFAIGRACCSPAPGWLRLLGGLGACLFALTAGRIYAGEVLLPTSTPLPFLAYPFLVATLLG